MDRGPERWKSEPRADAGSPHHTLPPGDWSRSRFAEKKPVEHSWARTEVCTSLGFRNRQARPSRCTVDQGRETAPDDRRRREPTPDGRRSWRSEEHTSELQSLMRISYAGFCLKRKERRRDHIRINE